MHVEVLEEWYKKNHRPLVFRESNNPYYIWVSEIMLQQTQVDTVIPYFIKFIEKFPSTKALSKTSEEEVLLTVQGLGYYRRFKNMHKAAKIISDVYKGDFPVEYNQLLELPGVGKYTAGAIMSIAYNKPFAATDGNVIRVISRYTNNHHDMRQRKHVKQIELLNQKWVEQSVPRIFTQALMEVGALICKPKNPQCNLCPLENSCLAKSLDTWKIVPCFSKQNEKKRIFYTVLIIEDDRYIYLNKRTESLLNGMYEYPQKESVDVISFIKELNLEDYEKTYIGTFKHIFTHLIWDMEVYHVRLLKAHNLNLYKIDKNQMDQYPMATAHKKIERT